MTELINSQKSYDIRLRLLASASVIVLSSLFSRPAFAAEKDGPSLWIEIGGQIEKVEGAQQDYLPPFTSALETTPFTALSASQMPPRYANGGEGRILFSPEGSDWSLSVAVRYGRANRISASHEETSPASPSAIRSIPAFGIHGHHLYPPLSRKYLTTADDSHSSDVILDFQAGKDVGLGAFGKHGESTLNVGVRFAQFTSQSIAKLDANPDFSVSYVTYTHIGIYSAFIKTPKQNWDIYAGKITAKRSFGGLGPTVQWDADATLIGSKAEGALTLDWGLNGALIIGRQKATVHHTTTARHGDSRHYYGVIPTLYPTRGHMTNRSRSVLVPNLGGFTGVSLRFPNAKISVGYRVDAYWGAIDAGIDTHKSYDRDFYGPFATISIGLP